MTKQVVVIAGPTGSGESSVTRELLARFPNRLCRLVTATTRPPRGEEQHGRDYYFFSKEDFLKKAQAGQIFESTYVANRDAYYGTYAPDLESKIQEGFIVVTNLDLVGAQYYKKHYNATTIFLKTPTVDDLLQRIQLRNPDMTVKELRLRREQAEKELEDEPLYDYVVVNREGQLAQTVDEVIEILQKEGYTLTP